MFFRFPWVAWALEPCNLHVFFSFFHFLLFFFFLNSPYQAARKPAFSDSLGPRKAFPKIPWDPKVVDEGPLLCMLKNT